MICIQVVRCNSKTMSLEKNQTPAKIAVSFSCCCGSMTSMFSVCFSSRGSTSETSLFKTSIASFCTCLAFDSTGNSTNKIITLSLQLQQLKSGLFNLNQLIKIIDLNHFC